MRGCAQLSGQVGIGMNGVERGRSSTIAVFSNHRVDGLVFAKLLDARREDDELGAVGQSHPSPVDGFVAKPCRVKLARIEIHNSFGEGLVHHLEINFQAKLGSKEKAFEVVSYK